MNAPDLAIVVPTLNEAENLPELVERLDRVLAGIDWKYRRERRPVRSRKA